VAKILSGDHALAAKLEPLISARHPSQLYEALGEGLLLGLLVWAAFLFKPRAGVIGCVFLLGYGTARFVSEFWRLPDSQLVGHSILGLSRGQFFSSLMLLTGVVILAWIFRPSAGKAAVVP
jgi:phosphatidylglycerol:prolipoprotein diacylglycerol transferase